MVDYEDRVLVDTNIIIYILNGNKELADQVHGRYTYLSFVSELELLSFPEISHKEEFVIRSFISDMNLVEMNAAIKRDTIRLRKTYRLKLPDAMVAATALYLNCALLTADKAFKRIEELDVSIALFNTSGSIGNQISY